MPAFRLALQFLTRLPVSSPADIPEGAWGRSLLYYPLVGVVIGVLLVIASGLLSESPAWLAAALVLGAWVLVTGALHLDGLADCADAWVGGHGDRERTLAIMKDACSGPIAVTVLVLVLLLKFSALAAGIDWLALLWIPVLARGALLVLFLTTPYVREGGLGSQLSAELPADTAWKVVALVAVVTIILLGWNGILLLAATTLVIYGVRRLLIKRLEGFTGDGAGALVELVETVCLIVLVI